MSPYEIWHPLSGWSSSALGWLLALSAGTAILLYLRLETLGRRLRSSVTPLGIASLSLAFTADESESILRHWESEGREAARQQLVLDYWFVPCYSTALAVLGVFAARWFARSDFVILCDVALALSWGQWLVGLVDYAENTTLLRILHTYPLVPERLAHYTGWFTRVKYLLIFLALGVTAFAFLTLLGLSLD